MGTCIVCGNSRYTFECSHCEGDVCKKHWRPDSHDCTILDNVSGPTQGVRVPSKPNFTPEAIDPAELKQKAAQPQSSGGASPDVARDGSIVEDSGDDWGVEEDSGNTWFTFQFSSEAFLISVKAYIGYLIGLAGLGLVVAGCYNLFAPLLFGGDFLFEFHHLFRPLAYENPNTPRGVDAILLYVSDVGLMVAGALMAWFS